MVGVISLMAAASLAALPAPAAETPVHIGQGASALYGSLLRPVGPPAPAAVLMIGGSGPEDRDGDDLQDRDRSQSQRLLALALVDKGVASLRYDKRGSGESAPAGEATSVDQLTEDAVRWARFLQQQPGVRCVVVVGHSEGAEIGTLAAHKVKLCGLVLVSGTSRKIGELIESQGAATGRSPQVAAQVHAAIQALKAGRPVPEVPKGYERLFGPEAVGYLRSEINLDPLAELAGLDVPVLVVQGDNDLQVSVDDARRLAAAAHVQLVIIPGMNHVLKLAPKDIRGNFMTYADPALPLAPGVADAIGDFVLARQ